MYIGVFDIIRKLIDKDWKGAWDSAKKIFTTFKDNIKSIIDSVREFFQQFLDWIGDKIEWVLNKVQGIKDFFGGGGSGSPTGDGGYARSASASAVLESVPHLASGSVIRGGNPFLAMLGDQPRGQVNVEAPAGLIKDMVKAGLAESGYGQERLPVNINLIYDGEAFARLSISDILSEMNRQGLDIEVLGAT